MVKIIGAGMAGLLCGAMFRGESQIFEKAESLPNNHHSLLRFRSNQIGEYLNMPFKEVEVMKIVKQWRNKVADNIGYSMKVGGRLELRSSRTAEGKVEKRYIAPDDFIQKLEGLQVNPILYNSNFVKNDLKAFGNEPIISTIPMSVLMNILDYPKRPEFNYRNGWVINAELDIASDICATIYYPDPESMVARATLTGSTLHVELVEEFEPNEYGIDVIMDKEVLPDFGFDGVTYSAELKPQTYAKINQINDRERRLFVLWATDTFNIYSLGRFAIWKPGLLLDDVFGDIRKIQNMLRNGNYNGRLK